jgi:hypothetical protein
MCISLNLHMIPRTLAQSPQKMSYQAIVRNSSGEVIANKVVGIKISILKNGNPVCTEEFSPSTNTYGLINITLGTVNQAAFSSIDWANGTYSLKTAIDPEGGTSYTEIGTSPLLSVPYAMHASTAESVSTFSYTNLTDKPDLSKYITKEVDGDSTNEIELPQDVTGGDMCYFDGTSWVKIEKPTDLNYRYSLEWDFNNSKPYWKVNLPSLVYNGTTLYIHPTDNSPGIRWYNLTYTTTNARSTTDGETNTAIIVANQGDGSYAAKLCADLVSFGFDDWYLPSKDELNAIYQDKGAIREFASAYYWSSTEYSNTDAWGQDFNNGSQVSYGKYPTSRCVCVRK